jgi:hypothetical protein
VPLCFINHNILKVAEAARILNVDIRRRWVVSFTLLTLYLCAQCPRIRGWACVRANLIAVRKSKIPFHKFLCGMRPTKGSYEVQAGGARKPIDLVMFSPYVHKIATHLILKVICFKLFLPQRTSDLWQICSICAHIDNTPTWIRCHLICLVTFKVNIILHLCT